MVCAKMDKEIPPEHIIRSSGNDYKQNKNKHRILLKGLYRVSAPANYGTRANTGAWTWKLGRQSPGRKRAHRPQNHKIKSK